jgi:hypothetical protein
LTSTSHQLHINLQVGGFFANSCTGISEIDDLKYPFVANIGIYDLRESPPTLVQCFPSSSTDALESYLPDATGFDDVSLKRLRHTKNFLLRYNLPHGDLKLIFEELMQKTKDAFMTVGLLSENDIMVYIRKNHTRFLKPGAFDLSSGGPVGLYTFVSPRAFNNCITSFGSVVQKTYGNILVVHSSNGNYGFEAIQSATKTMTTEQFLTLKGRCLAREPKARSEFENIFLRIAGSLSELRRAGLQVDVKLMSK